MAYFQAFKVGASRAVARIDDETIAAALEQAVRDGRPIDPDYGWWDDLPPDAVA